MAESNQELGIGSDRLIITHNLDAAEAGDTFVDWPLHVTLIPWFRSETNSALNVYESIFDELQSCQLALGKKMLGGVEFYGEAEDVMVRPITLDSRKILDMVHISLLRPVRHIMSDWRYIGGNYNPHMTIRENDDPGEGFNFLMGHVNLVRHDGDKKTVARTFDLGELITTHDTRG